MTLFTPSITEDAVFEALAAFVRTVLPQLDAAHVFQGQTNRVPQPTPPDYVVLVPIRRPRLSSNIESWDTASPAPTTIEITTPTQLTIQIDVHGESSGDSVQTLYTLMHSGYAVTALPAWLAPLYADEPQQLPFIGGEDQSENRWSMMTHLQINPALSTPAEFANRLAATVKPPADSS